MPRHQITNFQSLRLFLFMGCLNNKVETDKLPNSSDAALQEGPRIIGEKPQSIAFEIPNSEIKIRKGKPSRLNKQLYIIREVSNMKHQQLVESPLKLPQKRQEEIENVPEQLQYQPVQVKQKRTKTTKELSNGSDRNDQHNDSKTKTVNFIPEDHSPIEIHHKQPPFERNREKQAQNRSRKSDSRSQLSHRYNDEMEGLQSTNKKKRRGSVSLEGGSEHTYRSIHFKRAKTFHGEDQLVHAVKSISIDKGKTDAMSAVPVFIRPELVGSTDFEAEIKQITQKEGEESPRLLQLFHGLALEHEKNERFQEALSANAKYLRLARRLSGVDSCNYGAGLSHLSSIHYCLQDYQKAIQNSMKAKSIRSYAAIENDMHKARVLNQIGLIELQQNHLKEATHYLEEVREIHAKVVKGFDLSLEEMTPEAANNVSKNQYYDQSVQSMQTALKICLRAFGQNHLQTANHLDDLGTSYCDAGRYKESLDCFQRCFSIIRRMRLSKHKDFEAHSKHFFYNLEVIKLSPNCQNEVYLQAVRLLEIYFPDHDLLPEFNTKAETSNATYSNH